MSFFKLIRLPNLGIVVLTQCLLYYWIIRQVLKDANIAPTLDHLQFGLFVLVTTLITASSYIFNDIIDFKADQLNKPQKVMLGQKVSFQIAYWSSGVMLLIGFLVSFYLAMSLGRLPYLSIFPAAVIGLLFYNVKWKGIPLVGNFTIALYCAGVAAILWVAEAPALNQLYIQDASAYQLAWTVFFWYMLFAFFSTMIREIIKDLQDIKGDEQAGLKTMPIAWGKRTAKAMALLFSLLFFVILAFFGWQFHTVFGRNMLAYLCFGILLPVGFSAIWVIRSDKARSFYQLSQFWKGIMVLGLLMLLFYS
jgi:4-hydroxybenzoate polyprenyltransferase